MRAAPALFLALLASSRSELPAAVEPPRQVPPDASVPWETAAVPARRVTYHRLDSRAAGARVSYHLYRPAAYERETERRFPAVYWLHGSGGGGAGIAPLAAYKTLDETVTNSTTLQNDDALLVSLAANAVYLFAVLLDYEGAAVGTGDLKYGWGVPTGATMRASCTGRSARSSRPDTR